MEEPMYGKFMEVLVASYMRVQNLQYLTPVTTLQCYFI